MQGEALVLRYEGNLVFTVKVFGLDRCQKSFKSTKVSNMQQELGQSKFTVYAWLEAAGGNFCTY
jgi:hypothetical protein